MSTRWRLGVFALGAALFALVIYHAGPAVLLANLRGRDPMRRSVLPRP